MRINFTTSHLSMLSPEESAHLETRQFAHLSYETIEGKKQSTKLVFTSAMTAHAVHRDPLVLPSN